MRIFGLTSKPVAARSASSALGLGAALTALAAGLVVASPTAAIASTCPTVDASGTVTPSPTAGVDWSGCDLSDANLYFADFKNANLSDANLTGANLSSARLAGADLSNANLANANLFYVSSAGLVGTPLALPSNWTLRGGRLFGPSVNLDNASLSGLDLSGLNLAGAYMSSAYMPNANLTGATLDGADLYKAVAPGANLTDASLVGANMTSISLYEANLTDADLTNANLTNGYLDKAQSVGTNLTNANLTNVVLSNTNLSSANFASANMQGVRSGGITGAPLVLPADWSLVSNYLVGPGANLGDANLTDANLTRVNLTSAIFGNANLTRANLTSAVLNGAGLVVTNLTDADLTDADLTGANLFGATLTGATLTGATLTYASGCQLIGYEALVLPSGFGVVDGCLATSPEPPLSVTVAGAGSSATASWISPDVDGGAPITGYQVTVNPGARIINVAAPATSVVVTGLSAGVTYSFTVKAINAVGASSTLAVASLGSTLSAKAATSTITYGSSTTLSGTLGTTDGSNIANRKIAIMSKPSGATSWTTIGTATTTSSGKYTFTVKPSKNTYYAATYAGLAGIRGGGSDNGGKGVMGRTSASVLVSVAPKTTFSLNDSTASRTQTVTFSGTVSPNAKNQTVSLQRYVSGKWSSVKSMQLTASSSFKFAWKPTSSADYSFRVYIPARTGYAATSTTSKKLTVA